MQDEDDKIYDWTEALAADAEKTGSASERTCLIRRAACLIGKLWPVTTVNRKMFVLEIRLSVDLKWPPNKSSTGLST